eukprot:1152251_1
MSTTFALKKTKKTKKPKDTNAPKRPLSSYFIFAKENRSRIKNENPELIKATEITKKIGQEWRKLTEKEQSQYKTKSEELKAQYIEDMIKYKNSDSYKVFQIKLSEWKELQKESSNDTENTNSKANQKKPKTKVKSDAVAIDKAGINSKINSFFERYRDRLRKSKYPRQAVSNQYGWGLDKASQYITELMKTDMEGAVYGAICLARFRANIGMMDFSWGGPAYEIGLFMERVAKMINKHASVIPRSTIRPLYTTLVNYHKKWDPYCMGDDIKKVLDQIKTKGAMKCKCRTNSKMCG